MQDIIGQFDRRVFCWMWGNLKRPLFKPFVEQPEAGAIPYQYLHSVARTIDKHIGIAIGGITVKNIGDNAAESVETSAHIGGSRIQEEP